MKILLIGPMPPPNGGTQVSFKCLVESLSSVDDLQLLTVNTVGVRGAGIKGIAAFLNIIKDILLFSKKADVVTLHCSVTGLPFIAPIAFIASALFRKPLIIRKFGGSDYIDSLGNFSCRLVDHIIRYSDLYLVQTKQLVFKAKERGINNVVWFPNYRNYPVISSNGVERNNSEYCRKFIYVGDVRESKGINYLAEAIKYLKNDISVDIYGRYFDELDSDIFERNPRFKYCSQIEHEDVINVMSKYDALVLPTHYEGEGYPGVILEAYMAGLPVIATNWLAIPEIVDETVGILVEPRNAINLAKAMNRLSQDEELFKKLRNNVHSKAKLFSSKRRAEEFMEMCNQAIFLKKTVIVKKNKKTEK